MTYYTYRVTGSVGAHWYTSSVISLIRRDVGSDRVPIHVIGGIANMSRDAETLGFVHAIRERGVIGASFYTYPLVGSVEWDELRQISANPVQTPALPVSLGPAELGNLPGGDPTHPKEIVYRVGGRTGSWTLSFEGYEVQDVSVYVNWKLLGKATPGSGWAAAQSLPIPAAWLHNDAANYVAFVSAGAEPDWSTWGVRNVSLDPTPPPGLSAAPSP